MAFSLPDIDFDDFSRRHRIRRMGLFGSALRDDFGPDSDVDFWVEFEPDAHPGYFGIVGMEMELTQLLGRKADLRTYRELSRYFRDEVMRNSRMVHAPG